MAVVALEQRLIENQRSAKDSRQRFSPRGSYAEMITEWILKFALNARQELNELAFQGYQQLWESAFSGLSPQVLSAAFEKTLRECKFMPSVADVMAHIEAAIDNANKGAAELKWQQVLEYIRLHYNPDLSVKPNVKISDRTKFAIRAAGGLAYLSDCQPDEKQWAKKKFIEAYLRWEVVERDYALLPEGEFKNALRLVAESKAVAQLPGESRREF